MKRAIGLIAATLLTTSVYSQDYSSSSSSPDSTPPDYQSRQSEAGAPASSDSSSSSSITGYDVAPGTSGGNSLTGQSSGANLGSASDQDQTLTTRDSDVSGSEYRGSISAQADSSSTASGSAAGSESESASSSSNSDGLDTGTLRGTGTSDGAFHQPASPVREGAKSEGWSGSGTFSGAGPGTVSGSTSASDSTSSSNFRSESPSTDSDSSSSVNAEVSGNAALQERDEDLTNRGLEPDSRALSRDDSFSNEVEGNGDQVLIFEDWTIVEPNTNVGGPAGSDSGAASSSEADKRNADASASGSIGPNGDDSSDSYSTELHHRVQRDWSSRIGNTDVPATPGISPMEPRVMDHEFDHLRVYNSETSHPESDADVNVGVGAAASGESGASSSKHEKDCEDKDKSKGSSAGFESGAEESDTSAPGEYGDRATSENYDDGHLNGNNAKGSTEPLESSTSSSEDGALTQPGL